MNYAEKQEILDLAAQAFTRANKKNRNDQGRGHQNLGDILKRYMQLSDHSQSSLARAIERHPTFVNKVINGERGLSIETLGNLMGELGSDFVVDYLEELVNLKREGEW